MTTKEEGFLARLSAVVGRFRGFFLPFGLFSILAVGIHSGSDHIDDATFAGLNFFDAVADGLLTWIVGGLWRFFGASDATTQAAIYEAVDLVDLELKDQAARFVALLVELVADLALALPCFLFREKAVSLSGVVKKTLNDPTVLRVAAPVAAVLASVAGVAIITREVQVAVSARLLEIEASASFAGWVAGGFGVLALVLVTWRLGWVVALATARWAESRAIDDQRNQVSVKKRRLRGWFTALVALPISCWAFVDALGVIASFRSLIPG